MSKEAEHGTPLSYKRGCRCTQCRASNAERSRKFRGDRGGITDPVARDWGLVDMDDCTITLQEWKRLNA